MRNARLACLLALAVVAAICVGAIGGAPTLGREHRPASAATAGETGRDEREPTSTRPTVQAAFAAESYRPGSRARLVVFDSAPRVRIQLFRVGDAAGRLAARDVMRGTPIGPVRIVGAAKPGRAITIRLGPWPSGLYFATLRAPNGRLGYAPFVMCPTRLGEERTAVVLPTQTWQAYNFRDDDHDGSPDTWYQGPPHTTARLYRPFENRGVPPHYHYYDEPFLRWLARHHYSVDILSDAELNDVSGDQLARAYGLLIFSGHHEYVTEHEYDAVTRYRDLGGNLIFLSANNFYAKIEIHGNVMTRVGWWRWLDRPEAALIGVQFFHNDNGEHRGPWIVRASAAGRWIFRGTGLEPGDPFSSGGIEADNVAAASPRSVTVLAEIVDIFHDGRNAQMTYYRAAGGAQVFAAGAFSLAAAIWQPPVTRLVENLLAGFSK